MKWKQAQATHKLTDADLSQSIKRNIAAYNKMLKDVEKLKEKQQPHEKTSAKYERLQNQIDIVNEGIATIDDQLVKAMARRADPEQRKKDEIKTARLKGVKTAVKDDASKTPAAVKVEQTPAPAAAAPVAAAAAAPKPTATTPASPTPPPAKPAAAKPTAKPAAGENKKSNWGWWLLGGIVLVATAGVVVLKRK